MRARSGRSAVMRPKLIRESSISHHRADGMPAKVAGAGRRVRTIVSVVASLATASSVSPGVTSRSHQSRRLPS